ncbi:MAG: hypothetical protein N2748_05500 [candidate division WOR-3 bacterium]|nr:hypothetical protein [candidate division WOR-3 bacterium]
MLYKTTTATLIICTIAFGAITTNLGFRITTNITEEGESQYVPPDTWVDDTIQTAYTGLGVDFHITPYKNLMIRTGISELRFLYAGGTDFLIFPQIGADISYAFPIKKFYPYLTFGLYYRKFRWQKYYNYRAGFGFAYQLNDRFRPYLEIQAWDRTTKAERGINCWGFSTTEMLGLAKLHIGTTIKLGE